MSSGTLTCLSVKHSELQPAPGPPCRLLLRPGPSSSRLSGPFLTTQSSSIPRFSVTSPHFTPCVTSLSTCIHLLAYYTSPRRWHMSSKRAGALTAFLAPRTDWGIS